MSKTVFDAIPENRRDIAKSAISAAFGAEPTGVHPITNGASGALIYRIELAGSLYLLRLENMERPDNDIGRGYACMGTAAEAGIAPPLRYADAEEGVAIMDYLEAQSIFTYPTGREELARDLGVLIARLQDTPTFPPVEKDYPSIVGELLEGLSGSGRFAPGLLDPHREGYARLVDVYAWDRDNTVSSHNDLNPGNIIFDGRRLWLIDWEIAFRNDPMIDLGNLSNYVAQTPELRDALLGAWLGREPDRATRARLVLARQFARLAYACLMLSFSAQPGGPDDDLTAPSLGEFHRMMLEGEVTLGAPDGLYRYGKVFLNEFLTNLSAPDYLDAVAM
jgi:hypothetical protein